MKTWKLVSGILSTVIFLVVIFQSCAAGIVDAIENAGGTSFDAYADNYSVRNTFSALLEKSDESQLGGTIAPGKKMRGWIGWEVPSGWSEMEIHFTENFWSGNAIKFIINK